MSLLQNKVAELFDNESIQLFIGFRKTINSMIVPYFIEKTEQLEQLVFTPECKNNLAVYLQKPEIISSKKIGVLANIGTLRSLVQLISENQLRNIELTVVIAQSEDIVLIFNKMDEIEAYVQANFPTYTKEDIALLEKIDKMTRQERWQFWAEQFSACVKCYACRAVCPMCYCTQCTVECNQPQWIKVSAQTSGNFEWHTMRAMHLAGRCVNCGECGRSCPVDIPVHLLTAKMNQDIEAEFGSLSGFSLKNAYALNTFKPEDKEEFFQ